MARLINERTRQAHALDADEIIIGRHPSCHVQVLEKQVSRKHCLLTRTRAGWVLRDAGSMIGTHINGELLTAAYNLSAGDRIKVGTETFIFDETREEAHKAMHLRPLAEAKTDELIPFDVPGRRPRRRSPAVIGLALATLAIAALVALLFLTHKKPGDAIRRAAQLLRRRDSRALWEMLSDERRQTLTFGEFYDEVKNMPDEALDALKSLRTGTPYRAEKGLMVPVYLQLPGKLLTGEVVLYRQGGEWRIHDAPLAWLDEFRH